MKHIDLKKDLCYNFSYTNTEVLVMEISDEMILKWWYASKRNPIIFQALYKLPNKYSNIISGTDHYFHFDEYKKLPEDDKIQLIDCVITKIIKEMNTFVKQYDDIYAQVERLKSMEKQLGRPHKFNEEQIAQIQHMYGSGLMSMQDIANKMGCSKATISRYLDMRH